MDGDIGGVLAKAFAFVMIIVTGYVLKRKGFFHMDDFYLLSRIVLRITLPAAIVSNFSKITMDNSLLLMVVFGLLANMVYVGMGYLVNLRGTKMDRAFGMLNLSGYNIGNFTLPFVQSFLGPVGFATTSLFDAGNSVMCTGVTYTLASMVTGKGDRTSVGGVLKSLFSSLPFDAYIIMTILAILRIPLPEVVTSFAGTVGGANAFLALLMIGIGFEIHLDQKDKMKEIVKVLALRYGTALAFSLAAFFLLPFPLMVRQALSIVAFGPVSSVSPAFTGRIGGDVELSSAINSLSIVFSIVTITITLIVVL